MKTLNITLVIAVLLLATRVLAAEDPCHNSNLGACKEINESRCRQANDSTVITPEHWRENDGGNGKIERIEILDASKLKPLSDPFARSTPSVSPLPTRLLKIL